MSSNCKLLATQRCCWLTAEGVGKRCCKLLANVRAQRADVIHAVNAGLDTRHSQVDIQVLRFMRSQVDEHRDIAVEQMLNMLGKDDIFTKVAVESSINNIEQNVGQPIPEDARQWMGMLGFRVVIDFHGNVVDIQMPAGGIVDDDE